MENVLIVAVLVLLWGSFRALAKRRENKRRAVSEAIRDEDRRLRDCGEVVKAYANSLGYVARQVINRDELEQLIDAGITPDTLADIIAERCAEISGIRLGYQTVGSHAVDVRLPDTYRSRHLYVVGKSGSGKTTLLRNLIYQDLEDGRGLAVIAPEFEMIHEEILPFIPKSRIDDVVYINPADTEHPVSFNPLHVDEGEDVDLKVSETMAVLRRAFDDGAGNAPRMDTILRQGLYALMQLPGSTLLDFQKLLDREDDSFRMRALGELQDEQTQHFWRTTYPAYPKDAHLSLTNRLEKFLRPKVIRSLLCTPGESLNIRQAMDEGRVLLFNLSDGVLGEANAEVLGQLIVAKIQMAAMSRADTAKENRRAFTLYIDEFQSFCGVAGTSYEKILSRARKYNLSLVLAHQQTGQVPERLMREILGNVSTLISFAVGASDATRLSREFVGEFNGRAFSADPQDLLTLRVGQAVCRIDRNVFFLSTRRAPENGRAAVRDRVTARSRELYGATRVSEEFDLVAESPPPHSLEAIDPGDVFS